MRDEKGGLQDTLSFSPIEHAALFGILAQKILLAFGEDRGDALLLDGVLRYGEERGGRMRQRALKNGDPDDMISFFAYGEWRDPLSLPTVEEEQFPDRLSRVVRCRWQDSWKKYGLSPFGKYYCRCIDRAVLHGFNPQLRLKVLSCLSQGSDSCLFCWKDAGLDPAGLLRLEEMKQRLGDSCVKDWLYHTAHLYRVLADTVLAEDPKKGEIVLSRAQSQFGRTFSVGHLEQVLACSRQDFTVI